MKPFPKYKLTKSKREVLNNLQERGTSIITKADKVGAVIMDMEDHIKEANWQLSETSNYEKLNIKN